MVTVTMNATACFDESDCYLLTGCERKNNTESRLQDELLGHFVRLSIAKFGESAFFRVLLDDGWHLIRTSPVKTVHEDGDGNVTIETENTIYCLSLVGRHEYRDILEETA